MTSGYLKVRDREREGGERERGRKRGGVWIIRGRGEEGKWEERKIALFHTSRM